MLIHIHKAVVIAICSRRRPMTAASLLTHFDANTEGPYQCSQLIFKTYLADNMNACPRMPDGLLARIVFPQELWDTCAHTRLPQA